MADDTNTTTVFNYSIPFVIMSLLFAFIPCWLYFRKVRASRKNAVILFTRYPKPGQAKTRLIPELGPEGAAAVQVHMTEHILKPLQDLHKLRNDTDVVIQYNGGTVSEMCYWLSRKLHGLPCTFLPQTGKDLGEKLTLAVQHSFRQGHKNVIVIGGDIPDITSDIMNEAIAALGKADMVIGKAADGGYYLIGLSVTASQSVDKLFSGINWGTNTVYKEQVKSAEDLNLKVVTLTEVLQDVDTAEDIEVFERAVNVNRKVLSDYKWSVIIPVLNEKKNIIQTLQTILTNVSDTSSICDIVICDGGSSDGTCNAVTQFAKTTSVPIKLTQSRKGRGFQMLGGVKEAKGDYYLFIHADTIPPKNFDIAATTCLQKPGNVAGAFEFKLDLLDDPDLRAQESSFFVFQMDVLQRGVYRRCKKHELPYGDQGLFMSKKTYMEVGGFPRYRLMEDYIMVEKLHTIGHVAITDGHCAVTSYRRWKKHGWIRISGFNQVILLAYSLGVHPDTLARWYYGDKIKFD